MRIVFCGACNPVFNLKDLASEVRREFPGNADEVFLLLNGCRTACLKPENFLAAGDAAGREKCGKCEKMVYVAGTSVDGLETEESNLSEAVINAVKALYTNKTVTKEGVNNGTA